MPYILKRNFLWSFGIVVTTNNGAVKLKVTQNTDGTGDLKAGIALDEDETDQLITALAYYKQEVFHAK